MSTNSMSISDPFWPRSGGSNRAETQQPRSTAINTQPASLLRTAATVAILSVLWLLALQKAHAQAEATLYSFCSDFCLDGQAPNGALTPDGYGGFYGTTALGGTSEEGLNCYFTTGCGTVFQLVPEPAGGCPSGSTAGNGWCEYVVYNFCQISTGSSYCADGSNPISSLLVVRTGPFQNPTTTLYGTTEFGGASCTDISGSACGIVFELTPAPLPQGVCPSGTTPGNNDWCEKVIYSFCTSSCNDGGFPTGGLIRDSAGNLYGPAYEGVFKLSQSGGSWTESLIYSDANPVLGGLAMDASGQLYGVDQSQTNPGWGNVFKLTNSSGSWTATIIHAFDGSLVGTIPDGLAPNGPPAVDSAGNIYGTTGAGGSKNLGTVWKLTLVTKGIEAGTYKEQLLHSFTSAPTGNDPTSGVLLDPSGNIYGTALEGGKYLTPCKNSSGTAVGCGTVFELAVNRTTTGETYKYKLLWNFDYANGAYPSSLVRDNSGNLYGGVAGGANGQGAVFELNPSGAGTTITLTSSPNPSISGEVVTFTATVSSSAGAPPDGETVNFMDGLTVLGTGTLSGGSASFATSSLPVGGSVIDAVYSGDLNFAPSTSKVVRQVVKE